MTVIKRTGKIENLSRKKISDSITNANLSVKEENRLTIKQIKRITDSIYSYCETLEEPIDIDVLEDLIENKIMENGAYEVAKRYITYRYEKIRIRNNRNITQKLMAENVQNQNANVDEFSFGGRIGETASHVMKEYAINHLLSKKSKNNHLNNEIYIHDLDHYAVGSHNCLSVPFDKLLAEGFNTRQTDVRPASSINTAFQLVAVLFQLQSLQQFGGVAATHLDHTMVPYVRLSFNKHYFDGLNYLVQCDPDASPLTKSLSIKCPLSKEEIMSLAIDSDWYNHDPSAYKYAMDMTKRELDQAVEGMYHNLNTLQSRSGNQLPFTSINYGTCTLPEGRMVIKSLLEGCLKGVGKFYRTAIFPCGIFQSAKGINQRPGDPNYDLFQLALYCTSKRIYPNYANVDWSVDKSAFQQDRESKKQIIDNLSNVDKENLIKRIEDNPELKSILRLDIKDNNITVTQDVVCTELMSTMGCRTYNGFDIQSIDSYKKNIQQVIKNGTLYDDVQSGVIKDGRGNISPNTIILPTLAMQAKLKVYPDDVKECDYDETKVVETFIKILDKKINEARDMLLERFDWQCSQSDKCAKFMYENNTMCGYKSEEGIRSALKHGTLVIGQIGLAETLQILVGCDHTTEKGMELAKRIEQLFKDKCAKFKKEYKLNFGVYFTPAENACYTMMNKFKEKYGEIPNVSDKAFFTNSIHVPVWKEMDTFTKIDIESQLSGYSSGGCITYVELDADVSNNIEALEKLVLYAMEKDIPYFAINVPINDCFDCGYSDPNMSDTCPKCGSKNINFLRRVTGYLSSSYKHFNPGKQNEVENRVKHTGIELKVD